jgi:hypothetical protein
MVERISVVASLISAKMGCRQGRILAGQSHLLASTTSAQHATADIPLRRNN